MSNLKRFLAMTLVMVMMIGALAMSTSAKLFDDVEALKDADLSAAIDLLSELGIAKGTTTETFDPESPVTRQQFALFVARIHTATPEYFVSNETVKDEIPFGDLKDPTYYLAIKHCYENNIINGKVAPTEDALGTFDPEGEIMLQEAVTMLVRALGYDNQGLSYPVGFLAKAKEIGLLEGFGLAALKADSVVSRANMAGLLYNYFQGNYYEVNLVWNNSSAKYVEMVSLKPVAEKFGITKIEGYVTAIEGAALPMWVEDQYASGVLGAGGAVTDMNWVKIGINDPISIRNAANLDNGGFDIIISWVTPETTVRAGNTWQTFDYTDQNGVKHTAASYIATSTNERVVGHLRTNKAALGLAEDYKDLEGSRYLLGLKVIAYLDTANKGIKLPAPIVVGTKTRAVKSAIDGTVLSTAAGFQPTLNNFKFTDADGVASTFIQYNYNGLNSNWYLNDNWTGRIGDARNDEGDINFYTGYVFTSNKDTVLGKRGLAVNMHSTTLDQTNLLYLARVINTGNADKGAMDIDVIDNGFNRDGTPNRYVIFTPYEARYIRRDHEGNKQTYRGNGNQVDISLHSNIQYVDATTFKASAPVAEKAYYLNDQGEYVIMKQELVEVTKGNTLGYVIEKDANKATFRIGVASASNAGSYGNDIIDFSANAVKFGTLYNRSNAADIAYTNSGTGNPNSYTLKEYDGFKIFTIDPANYAYGFLGANTGSFFIYRDLESNNKPDRRWGYVMSSYGSDVSLADGSLATSYKVWNIKTGTTENILDVSPRRSVPYKAGEHISYMTVGFNTPNTHKILAAVNPFGERFQVIGNETGSSVTNSDRTSTATPTKPTQTDARDYDAVRASVDAALAAFRKAMNAAMNKVDGPIDLTGATGWNTIMKTNAVSGAVSSPNAAYTDAIDKILGDAGNTGILSEFDIVNMFGNAAALTIVSGNLTWSIMSGTAASIIPVTVTNAINALSGNVDTLNANVLTTSQALKVQAVIDAINAFIAALDANSKAAHPAAITNPDELTNMANGIKAGNLIADMPVKDAYQIIYQSTSDAILKTMAKAIMEGAVTNGLWDITQLITSGANTGLNPTCFNQSGAIDNGVLTMINETATVQYKLSFEPFYGAKQYALDWTGTTETGLSNVSGVLYVQVSTYTAATTSWSAWADLGSGSIDFKNLVVKFTNDPATHKPLDGRLVNLGLVNGAEDFLLNDANTYQTRTAYGISDMKDGINIPTNTNGLMYNFEQATNILTIGDNHETVTNRVSATITDSTYIVIYDVNNPMTQVNSLRLADFKALMKSIHNNAAPIQAAIKSAVFVRNYAEQAEVLYVGIDPTALNLKTEQLNDYKYAMNLKYNPIIAPADNSSNPTGSGYYTVMSRSATDYFTVGGTVYHPITIKDTLTGLEKVGKFAIAATDSAVVVGSTVYVTSSIVNGHNVVSSSTIRTADLTTANINEIIALGAVETKIYSANSYSYNPATNRAYVKSTSGITFESYGSYVPYIEISKNTSGTYSKVANYKFVGADATVDGWKNTISSSKPVAHNFLATGSTIAALAYDLVDVRHIGSNGLVIAETAIDTWTPGIGTNTGTVYVVPYDTNGGFAIIVVK